MEAGLLASIATLGGGVLPTGDEEMILLFRHTSQGNKALRELDEAGVAHEAIRVVGDLGAATSQAGAERHVTLDRLHVPAEERELFMEVIRSGGVVLAVDLLIVDAGFLDGVAIRHDAMRTIRTFSTVPAASHNVD